MRRLAPALLLSLSSLLCLAPASMAAPNWRCEERRLGDGVCDCGCGRADSDCSGATFEMCERSGCPAGQVPWEHSPESCMTSACGDGWVDEAAGEVCDDGEALAGGGCAAACDAVNDGWTCGERAAKCARLPTDADVTEPGADGEESDGDAAQPVADDAAHGGDVLGAADVASEEDAGPVEVHADASGGSSDAGLPADDATRGGPVTGGAGPEAPAQDEGCAGGTASGLLMSLVGLVVSRRRAA